MSSSQPILIVGAGPTGLVLALYLAHYRIPFRIIEKNSGPGQFSRAMAVQARTLEFYDQLEIANEVVAQGIKMETFHLRENDKEITHFSLKNMGETLSPFPFVLSYPQDDHEKFLVEKLAAQGISVEWNTELMDFTQNEKEVYATIKKGNALEKITASYLCGCDGARSQTRKSLGLDFPGGTYQQIFYVADVKIKGKMLMDLFVNLGANSFALLLPVRSSGMQRLIGIVPQELSNQKEITFEHIKPYIEPLIGIQIEDVNWFSTYHVHHRVAPHFRSGRCFLAGDAAHIHSPAGGQGMNTGIGDAVNLAWKLAQVFQQRINSSILDTYEQERMPFAQLLVATTDRFFQAIVDPTWKGHFTRTWLVPHALPFLVRFSFFRNLIFKLISQIRINYRNSFLSEGDTGKIYGGKRLPWVNDTHEDNFKSLRLLDWQIHIYGELQETFKQFAKDCGISIQIFTWTPKAKKAGLKQHAAYLIRPDGYIALVISDQQIASLKNFISKIDLSI